MGFVQSIGSIVTSDPMLKRLLRRNSGGLWTCRRLNGAPRWDIIVLLLRLRGSRHRSRFSGRLLRGQVRDGRCDRAKRRYLRGCGRRGPLNSGRQIFGGLWTSYRSGSVRRSSNRGGSRSGSRRCSDRSSRGLGPFRLATRFRCRRLAGRLGACMVGNALGRGGAGCRLHGGRHGRSARDPIFIATGRPFSLPGIQWRPVAIVTFYPSV